MIDPVDIMRALARRRPIFHSEADFQHAFAWEIHRSAPEFDIRLEVPVRATTGAIHLDLLARSTLGQMAIELKYKTRSLTAALDGEDFHLMSHAAQDLGRYDFFKDLNRIEEFAREQGQSEPAMPSSSPTTVHIGRHHLQSATATRDLR